MSEKYILDGHTPVLCQSVAEWGRWFEANRETRRVGYDEIDGVRVSTVFLGIDHAFGVGLPLLFETMVFGGALDEEQQRCSTWDEAESIHRAMVGRVKASLGRANAEIIEDSAS